jgi:hypothetical protein
VASSRMSGRFPNAAFANAGMIALAMCALYG